MPISKTAFTVALVGADGAGKSTIGRRLAATLPLPVTYLYMGDNPAAATDTLPTTRLLRALRRARGARPAPAGGPPDPTRRAAAAAARRNAGTLARAAASARAGVRLANRLAEEWYRQFIAWRHLRRGRVVLFDRHFFADYYAHDIAPADVAGGGDGARPLSERIHGLVLARLYPRPDLVVCLDAPAEVLFARKGEGTVESLERRRREYFAMRDLVTHFVVVDASRPEDEVASDVSALVVDFYRARAGLTGAPGAAAPASATS
ncbi:MAG TPA: hypothetical protein VKA84_02320 [Gemmatimonadaceae bacterium]|nr:hypothetical protein [Gemmatimonadaceae bacterium]